MNRPDSVVDVLAGFNTSPRNVPDRDGGVGDRPVLQVAVLLWVNCIGQHAFGKVPVVEKGLTKSMGRCLSNTVIEDRMPWTHVPEEYSWV